MQIEPFKWLSASNVMSELNQTSLTVAHPIHWGILLCTLLAMACNAEQDTPEKDEAAQRSNLAACVHTINDDRLPSEIATIQSLASTAAELALSLSETQNSTTRYCVGDPEQHSWTNVPGRRSGGMRLNGLSVYQQKLVWILMHGFLSTTGYDKIRFLATEIEEASGAGTLDDYTIAIFGRPSIDAVWGFQYDGHHIALNFLVDADDVVLSPAFVGSQPLELNGRKSMADEYSLGRKLFNVLAREQQAKANLPDLVRRSLFAGSGGGQTDRGKEFDFASFSQTGLPISDMNEEQIRVLIDLVKTYLLNLDPEFADKTIETIVPQLTDGFFVYSARGSRVYYRVFVDDALLIEYGDVGSDHLHTVTRLLGKQPMLDYGGYATARSSNSALAHLIASDHHQHVQ